MKPATESRLRGIEFDATHSPWRAWASRAAVVLAAVILLAPGPAHAQAPSPWPVITPEELAFKEVSGMAGAPAAILYREVITDDEKRFETHYYRVKILTEQGKKYANIEIPYALNRTQIDDFRARTIQPDGRVNEFQGQVFDRLIAKARKVSYQAKVITLPEVNVGSIMDYAYTIHWKQAIPDIIKNPSKYYISGSYSYLTSRWTVHDDLYIRKSRFLLRPVKNGRIVYTWIELSPERKPVRNADGTVELVVENFPAFVEEEFMPPESFLKARVDLFYVVGPALSVQNFWASQAGRMADSADKFIGEPKKFTREVERITSAEDSPETKLRKIYDFVQKIRFLSFEPSRTEKEQKRENLDENKTAEDILKHGYAYANDINYLFVALARAAGLQAFIVRVTARRSNFFAKEVLDADQLNAIVVLVSINSKNVFLDPATQFCPFGLLPWEETDAEGIVVSNSSTPFIKTSLPNISDAITERNAELKLDSEGALSGSLTLKFFGLEALSWRLFLLNKDEVARRKALEDYVKEMLPTGSTVDISGVANQEKLNEPFVLTTRIQVPSISTRAGRRLLLPAGILQTTSRNQFQSANRKYPVYFRYPYRTVDDIRIEVPPELSVESMPQAKSVTYSVLTFEGKYERQDRALRFQRRQDIGGYYFEASNYHLLRDFFSKLHVADEQQVVLLPAQPKAAQ